MALYRAGTLKLITGHKEGALLHVRVTPRAGRDGVDGVATDANGADCLKISLTAVPEDGKANAALVKFLGKQLGLAPSLMSVERGASARVKQVLVRGDPKMVKQRLKHWIEEIAT